jgi:predicted RNA-binding Zn-ribbon protein involved in translation (DUF1610 family)
VASDNSYYVNQTKSEERAKPFALANREDKAPKAVELLPSKTIVLFNCGHCDTLGAFGTPGKGTFPIWCPNCGARITPRSVTYI